MSGADLSADDIANGVFHALYPECPAFPGVSNECDTQICDCFNADQLPAKVAALAARVRELETALIQQAKLTAYYNGKGNDLAYPSPNYPGKEVWWDYLTEAGRAALASPQRNT